MELCEKMGIPYLSATYEHYKFTLEEICEFYKANGIHFYAEENDVVYVGNGYIGLHSTVSGKKSLRLPSTYTVLSVFGADIPTQRNDCIEFELKENSTVLFAISK